MSMDYETGLLSVPIKPKTPADEERLARALEQLLAEDPTIRVQIDQQSREVVLGGSGELHLEIITDRLKRDFGVEAFIGRPHVAYREVLTRPADGEMKHVMHADGRNQYAHVRLRLLGAPQGTDYVFVDCVSGGSIPSQFIQSADEGIREALSRGVLSGYPVVGVRAELYDGSYHDVDSTKEAFRIAGALAAIDAAQKAAPILLEPVMLVEVTVPEVHGREVVGNLRARRGLIDSRQDRDGTSVILARAPLAELLGYAADIRQRTGGRGAFSMRFYRYEPCRAAGGDEDAAEALVGAPLKPRPHLRVAGVALPEPDEPLDPLAT
jgi:elongation factor G